MSKPFRSLALRPFLPADTPLLASIFARERRATHGRRL